MRLSEFTIHGFKAFRDETLRPADLTVLIGANGSGKTSTLQAIELLGAVAVQSFVDKLEERNWEYADLFNKSTTGQEFGFKATFDHPTLGQLTWKIRLGKRKGIFVAGESVTCADGRVTLDRRGRTIERTDAKGNSESYQLSLGSSMLSTLERADAGRYPEQWAIAEWARSVQRYVALDPAELRRASRKAADIGLQGERLGGMLRTLRDRSDGSFDRVIDRVRHHYPHLSGVGLKQLKAGWTAVTATEKWGKTAVEFQTSQISDGLLRMLAVACVAEMQDRPSLVMFDEIENGVHPALLAGLVEVLRDLSAEGTTQVLVTTHSPIILNALTEELTEDVVLVARDAQGVARLRRLADNAKFAEYRNHMGIGELWFALGDEVLAG